ncbi:hypothetical protein R6Y95_06135 [Methanoculleus palmolei]|uniref:K Homology domain-containing protein n=1 Tax=Methanoculleus palmolei TaxID=72612 RepID=A0ABD8A697_9EURY|nr:hypothetical protein R6Y95_06135 [Methanoculleus palmolei]
MSPDPSTLPVGSGPGAVVVEYRHLHISEDPDSIEVGTPGKGGAIKVYGNFRDPEGFRAKIKAAYELRRYAAELLGGGPDGR